MRAPFLCPRFGFRVPRPSARCRRPDVGDGAAGGGWRHRAPERWSQRAHDRPEYAGDWASRAAPTNRSPWRRANACKRWWMPATGGSGCCPVKRAKDHYGRTLAHLYGADGTNLEAQMLADGLGFQVAVAPNVDLVACQQAAERSARQAGLGLWRQSPVLKARADQRVRFRRGQRPCEQGVSAIAAGSGSSCRIALVLRVAPNLLGQFDSCRHLSG